MRAGAHSCQVYRDAADRRPALVAFFAAGVAAGERCMLLASQAEAHRLERWLDAAGVPAASRRRAFAGGGGGHRRLLAASRQDDPGAVLGFLHQAERQALVAGHPGLRVAWAVPPRVALAARLEIEALLDRELAGSKTTLLCQYARRRSPPALLEGVLRAHATVMIAGEIHPNVFYEPAAELLTPGAPPAAGASGRRGEAAASDRVAWMLDELGRGAERERRLRELDEQLAAKQVELAQEEKERQRLLDMLAHELRNPLGTVRNALQVLRLRGGDDETLQRALQAAERQVFHQALLVDDLLEAARITHGEIVLHRERVDLGQLVPDVVDGYHESLRESGLGLDLQIPLEPLPVYGDRLRLAQAVAHLLRNALKFSPRGARVSVRVERTEGGRAEISVRNSGGGISADLFPHLFEVFTQGDRSLDRAKGGLGVGLAVVKGLIELHGGEVRAESRGSESEFMLLLPLDSPSSRRLHGAPSSTTATASATATGADAGAGAHAGTGVPGAPDRAGGRGGPSRHPETGAAAPAPPQRGSGALRVLVVEDNADAAITLRDFLELLGFQVALAYSGSAGVETARRFHPQVVLCDLGLPGMDGFEVAARLRRDPATSKAQLIAVTGYGRDEDRRRAREAGFDLHLTKPVDPSLLRRLLQERSAAAALRSEAARSAA